MSYHYRIGVLDDVPAISELLTEFFAYNAAQQPEDYLASVETGEYPDTVIRRREGDFIVAEADGLMVGLVHVEADSPPAYPSLKPRAYGEIVDFIVREGWRKKGIGHALLEQAKEWAWCRGLESLELMVLENNHLGLHFYEREHFTTVSRTLRLHLPDADGTNKADGRSKAPGL